MKLYTTKTPITSADLLNDQVLPFYEEHGLPVLRILTDRGTEFCGRPDRVFCRARRHRKLAAVDYDTIPDELMKWTRVGRKRERGLVNRRAAEVGLWSKGSFVASAYVAAIKDTPAVID